MLLIWRFLHLWRQTFNINGCMTQSTILSPSFPNVHQFKKILSPANQMKYLQWSDASQLKCLDILPCHLSLITIHISDCCQFSDIHISQASVATYLSCGGICTYGLLQIYQWVCQRKNFENRLMSCFFLTHGVVHDCSYIQFNVSVSPIQRFFIITVNIQLV